MGVKLQGGFDLAIDCKKNIFDKLNLHATLRPSTPFNTLQKPQTPQFFQRKHHDPQNRTDRRADQA